MNHDPNSPDPNYPRFGQQEPQQYGLQNFDIPRGRQSGVEQALGPKIIEKLTNPLVATSALVVAGVIFAGVLFTVSGSDDAGDIPIVTADATMYKETPSNSSNVAINGADSTVFSTMQGDEMPESAPLENLLEDDSDTDELAAFAREVEGVIEEDQTAAETEAEEEAVDTTTLASNEAEDDVEPVTLQKIESKPQSQVQKMDVETVVEKPVIVHKAGENPETLEFVRSVLEKKDAGSANDVATQSANAAASVQPAAGNATRDISITPGSYYVQLASIKSLTGAEGEWAKLQDTFSKELGTVEHRVQAADLGERGTFYRIQAGPMSKDSAVEICESIKAQKPGGCLVTQ